METCPHGQRIVCADGRVVFVDACQVCETLLVDLGFTQRQPVRRTA